jgi:hypothetical protein
VTPQGTTGSGGGSADRWGGASGLRRVAFKKLFVSFACYLVCAIVYCNEYAKKREGIPLVS